MRRSGLKMWQPSWDGLLRKDWYAVGDCRKYRPTRYGRRMRLLSFVCRPEHLFDGGTRLRNGDFPRCALKRNQVYRSRRLQAVPGKVTAQEQFGFDDVRKFVPNCRKRISRPTSLYWFAASVRRGEKCDNAQISFAWMLHKYPNVVPIPGSKNQERILENLGLGTSRFPVMSSGSYNQHWMNVRYTDIVGAWKRNRRVLVNNGVKKQLKWIKATFSPVLNNQEKR